MKKSELREMIREEILKETNSINTAQEMIPYIEKTIKKYFPKSLYKIEFEHGLEYYIAISFAVGNKGDFPSGMPINDICYVTSLVQSFNKDGTILGDKLEYDADRIKSILLKPKEGSHLAFDRAKTKARSKKGTSEQILKQIDNNFKNLLQTLRNNKDNFAKSHQYVNKYI